MRGPYEGADVDAGRHARRAHHPPLSTPRQLREPGPVCRRASRLGRNGEQGEARAPRGAGAGAGAPLLTEAAGEHGDRSGQPRRTQRLKRLARPPDEEHAPRARVRGRRGRGRGRGRLRGGRVVDHFAREIELPHRRERRRTVDCALHARGARREVDLCAARGGLVFERR